MKTILVLSVLVIITTPYCYSAITEESDNANDFETPATSGTQDASNDEFKVHAAQCGGGGGTVYTRWGRTVCPAGRELIYKGLVVGADHMRHGGGADYLCLHKQPQYLTNEVRSDFVLSYIFGANYQLPGFKVNSHDIPCAVCYTSQRSAKLIIPGRTSCPSSWTEEYEGYLVAERSNHNNHRHTKGFECLDKSPEGIPRTVHRGILAHVDLVSTKGTSGLPSSYVANKPITCVLCTK